MTAPSRAVLLGGVKQLFTMSCYCTAWSYLLHASYRSSWTVENASRDLTTRSFLNPSSAPLPTTTFLRPLVSPLCAPTSSGGVGREGRRVFHFYGSCLSVLLRVRLHAVLCKTTDWVTGHWAGRSHGTLLLAPIDNFMYTITVVSCLLCSEWCTSLLSGLRANSKHCIVASPPITILHD